MPLEFRKEKGKIVWVKNPFNGTISYYNGIHKKKVANFSSQLSTTHNFSLPVTDPLSFRADLEHIIKNCIFCPGNEGKTPREILRINYEELYYKGLYPPDLSPEQWSIRAFPNIIPRIPSSCTGGKVESYVVVEDSRHFLGHHENPFQLLYSASLPLRHFYYLLKVDVSVMEMSYRNPEVKSVIIRKNQGAESGASQPHTHNQVIGSDHFFPDIQSEIEKTERDPEIWNECLGFLEDEGLILEEVDGVISYRSPFGKFPISFDVILPDEKGLLPDLKEEKLQAFCLALYKILHFLGSSPLDYEIHCGPKIPIHAHINSRAFTFSNVAGTINIPEDIVLKTVPVREYLSKLSDASFEDLKNPL